jgi:hypothetical protein
LHDTLGIDIHSFFKRWGSKSYNSVLQTASAYGHALIVKLLLDAGADPNSDGSSYGSALLIALVSDHAGCVDALLAAGADPYLLNGNIVTSQLKLSAQGNVVRIPFGLVAENGTNIWQGVYIGRGYEITVRLPTRVRNLHLAYPQPRPVSLEDAQMPWTKSRRGGFSENWDWGRKESVYIVERAGKDCPGSGSKSYFPLWAIHGQGSTEN